MRKINLLLVAAFITSSIFAQDEVLTSKKGERYLPETGEWAISINASPFLSYFGNFIGGNGLNAAPNFNFLSTNQFIIGKYFIDNQSAYRAGVRLGFSTESNPPLSPTSIDDKVTVTSSNIGLSLGKEFRKGKTRLQGFYGAEAGLNLSSTSTTNKYGTAISASNSPRVTEFKGGMGFDVGVRGFIGAEYFIIPKVAIGGEFGWSVGLSTTGESETTREVFSAAATTTKVAGSSSLCFDNDHQNSIFGPSGTIRLTLHF